MPLEIPMQSNQGGDSGAADAFKPLVDSLDLVSKYLSDESPLFKRQNQLLQQLVQINQRQLRTQAQAGRGASGGAGGVGKQTEAISKNIATQDTASSALKSFESIVSLTTSPLSKFAKTTGFASVANIASIASTGKAALSTDSLNDAFSKTSLSTDSLNDAFAQTSSSTNSLNDAFAQTIKPIEDLRKAFASAGAGFTGGTANAAAPAAAAAGFTGGTAAAAPAVPAPVAPVPVPAPVAPAPTVDLDALQKEVNSLTAEFNQADMDLQATTFYLQEFQNSLESANMPMNNLSEVFDKIADTGGILSHDMNSLFNNVKQSFGKVNLSEFQNKLFEAVDLFTIASNKLLSDVDFDSMTDADASFAAFSQKLSNISTTLMIAHQELLDLASGSSKAALNFDKADAAAKKLADQLKIAQAALIAAGGAPAPAVPIPAAAPIPAVPAAGVPAAAPIPAAGPAAGPAAAAPAAEDKMKQFADEISADFKMLYGGIKDLIKATYTKTKEVGKSAVNVVKGAGSAAASPVETMKTGLGMGRNVAGAALKGGYGAAKGAIKGAGSALSTGVTAGFSTALKGATGSLGALAKAFGMAGGPVTMLATTIATATIGNIVAFGAELTHGMDVMTGLTKATSFVGTYFGKLVNGALAPFAKGMNYASNALDRAAMAADLSGMAMRRQAELAKAAGEIQKTATASIMNAVKAPLTGLPDLIKQVASYVEVVDPAAAKLAQDSLRGFTAVIGKVLQPALGILVQGLNYVAGQLMSEKGFKGLSTAVAAIATMIVEKVKGIDFEAFIDDLLKSAATMIEALSNISSITMGLAEMFNGLIGIISALWDGLSALASGVYTVVDFLVIAFMDGLKSVVNAFIAIARTFGSSMKYFELGDAVKTKFGEGPAKDKPEKPQAAAANLAALPVQNASFKGLADVGKEMQTRSFSAGVSLEKMQMEMATNINDLLKNPTASALFQAFKNMGGGFIAPDANAQGV